MYYYIVNPAAGNSRIDSMQEKLKTTLHRLNIDGEFAKTIGPGDAARMTKAAIAKGSKTIVAVGGDDTVNEIVTALQANQDQQPAIGIIPTGSHNTLANHLGIKDWQQACKVLSARRLQDYNLMKLNNQLFIYSCEITRLPKEQPAEVKQPPAWQKVLPVRKPGALEAADYVVSIDDNYKVRGKAAKLVIYNQKFLNSKLDNDLLLQIYDADGKPAGGLRRLLKRLSGSSSSEPNFSQLHAHTAQISIRQKAVAVIDGRPVEDKDFSLSLTRRQVRLISNLSPEGRH